MAEPQRVLREGPNVHLHGEDADGWSGWVAVMRRYAADGYVRRVRDDGQRVMGFRRVEWTNGPVIADYVQHCGIYEFKVVYTVERHPAQRSKIVYVGSTCRNGGCQNASLQRRIQEYLNHGSHKRGLINTALSQPDAEIKVRVKPVDLPDERDVMVLREQAETMENNLLAQYDYAWNERQNGQIRRRNLYD